MSGCFMLSFMTSLVFLRDFFVLNAILSPYFKVIYLLYKDIFAKRQMTG